MASVAAVARITRRIASSILVRLGTKPGQRR
jgi:hypothetical protein